MEDAFDVIVPSLPGFGFSGRPPRPIGPRRMAELFNTLMTQVLGYDGYLSQGGDWGGAISSWLGFDHAPACRAIHINILTMRHPDGPQGPEEEAWAAEFEREQLMENGYRTQQATKPQTLSYAMLDRPSTLRHGSTTAVAKRGGACCLGSATAWRFLPRRHCFRRNSYPGPRAPTLNASTTSRAGPRCLVEGTSRRWSSLGY